ncbi:hypothetical protein A3A95_01300 [Candidatus Nomurabacteria bacterium RIFCSPLOWO2_01_FULL_39_18]|uniref:Methyltransferase FkbM domain-containing protein n=1 Tax=Candidatus Nomurabacteria bacterium RIFCSPHIGHO2_01_FULL_40_24b TaxID=1801739 RepID=A0A1F6V8H4_9BACT|nr:MAG: hypothetical protein A2647_00390 [Candidatus Nomurabacteria bacterium RIFCSPHIGHO2_01_FULL_40_24b]OGI88925.1 MAG: hypothetical protein A3A95_01300 [Candidatus Nomurabacteria bacterium RIFCSPLOWO2_01_FULL_39_18]
MSIYLNNMKNNIKKYVGKLLPENIKYFIRKILNFVKHDSNTKIPIEELKIFEALKDSMQIVFDIGAREDLSFFSIKKNCFYHLFEPNKKFTALLKKQISLLENHNIKLNEFGLSDKNEDNCIYYEQSQSFVINPFIKDIDTGQRYSLRTLDEYVSKNKIPFIDFLKIDAEGMDYRIIKGGADVIKNKTSYIQFEYWDGVKKFVDILGNDFNLYLMIEPRLLDAILNDAINNMTQAQKQKDYTKSITALDNELIDLIDGILIPKGYGGNILGIKKNINNKIIEKIK